MGLFSQALTEKINGFLGRYETKRSAILPVLHAVQDERGWVSDEDMDALQADFGLDKVQVREVLTFYSMYRKSPPRQFEVLFCENIVCAMMGAKEAMAKIEARIEAFEKRTGKPSPFHLQGVPCLGVCDGAPAMLVGKERHLKVTQDNIDGILERYAATSAE